MLLAIAATVVAVAGYLAWSGRRAVVRSDGLPDDTEAMVALSERVLANPADELSTSALVRDLVGARRRFEAIDVLRVFLQHRPESDEARLVLAGIYAEQGLFAEAVELFQGDMEQTLAERLTLVLQRPDIAEVRRLCERMKEPIAEHDYVVGQGWLLLGKPRRAGSFLQRYVQENAESMEALMSVGMALMLEQRYEMAVEVFREITAVSPQQPMAHYALASALRLLGDDQRLPEALRELDAAISTAPDEPLFQFEKGLVFARQSNWQAAATELEPVVSSAPWLTEAWRALSLAYRALGDLTAAAIAEAEYHARLGRSDLAAQVLRARAGDAPEDQRLALALHRGLISAQRYDEANQLLDQLLREYPGDDTVLEAQSEAWERTNQTASILDELNRKLEADPRDASLWSRRGAVLQTLVRYEESEADFRRAVELDPENAQHHLALGQALFLFSKAPDRLDLAEVALRQALRLQPTLALAHHRLGSLLLAQNAPEAAESHLRRALELDPKATTALQDLSRAYASEGQHERAKEMLGAYQRAVELEERTKALEVRRDQGSRDVGLRRELANGYLLDSDLLGGIRELTEAVRLEPNHTQSREVLFGLLLHTRRFQRLWEVQQGLMGGERLTDADVRSLQ